MREKPTILHCCPSPGPLGGIWTYIKHIKESRLADQYHFGVCFYPGPSVGISARVIRQLAREVRSHSPDLVHLHGLQTEGFNCMMGALLGGGSPRLLTVHGFIEDSKFRSRWRRHIIANLLEPMTVRCAHSVFTVSRYGAEKDLLRRRVRGNLGFINNALPPGPPPDSLASQAIRQSYGWAASDVVAVCITRMSREKGLLDLVTAFEYLAARHSTLRLLLAGDGPAAALLRARLGPCISAGRAVICPATRDVSPLLGASDLFVLPSLHENQSFAILEAMVAGIPVVSTAVGGTPELVTSDETGLLVSPGHPAQLAEAMERMIVSPELRQRLGRAGKQAIERDHSFEGFIEQLGSVYRRMLTR